MSRLAFKGSVERLGRTSLERFSALPDATYTPSQLRTEVHAALSEYYGSSIVDPRNKCIKVDARPGYVHADVVPCIQYRWFKHQEADVSSEFVEGVAIHPLRGGMIINFPKEHIRNGQLKNAACSMRYKPTVRQIKRLRNRAVEQGYLVDWIAPGYLLECMVYNVPPDRFVSDDSERLADVVLWLQHADKAQFQSCDEVHTLFGTDPGDFDVGTAQKIIDALWEAY